MRPHNFEFLKKGKFKLMNIKSTTIIGIRERGVLP